MVKGNISIWNELKRIARRLDGVQKSIDFLSADREILEDVLGRLTALEDQSKLTRKHNDDVKKDIKDEVNKVEEAVGAKVDEINIKIDDKTVVETKTNPWWKRW